VANSSAIEIPLTVEIRAIGSGGSWEIIDLIDERDGTSLGDIGLYSFDADSEFMEALMNGALEALFEYESFDPEAFYSVSVNVRDDGTEIGLATKYFPGHTFPLPPRNWRASWLWPSVANYLPYLDDCQRIVEPADEYVRRMQATVLPHWPEEPLVEWLHRNYNSLKDYGFLGYDSLHFELQTWDLEAIPGREAFADPGFCDDFSGSFEYRVREVDWLARYMNEHGTWSTPIYLLENLDGAISYPWGERLNQPYHLLEGHRRLSFLVALRHLGKALPGHQIWLARKRFDARLRRS
jgi:hypothetical protein